MFRYVQNPWKHSWAQHSSRWNWLSAVCYWYIAGEETALQYLSLYDVGADSLQFISQVSATHAYSVCMCTCSYIRTATYVVVTCIGLSSSLLHILIPTKIYAFTIPAYLL